MLKKRFVFTIILFIGASFIAEQCYSIPAFARKYRLSCKTCHSPASPKLKDYGDTFAGDGFRLEDEEAPRYYVPTGDDKLSLIRDFPIAVRLDGFVSYNVSNKGRSDLEAPYLMKILSGGELSEHLSYYFYFYMDERGKIAGVEDAFLMVNNLFNKELDVYLGQFQVSDPLFKRELRLSLEDYKLYTSQIGNSDIKLTYDKGVLVELGLNTGTTIVMEVVNGNGLVEAQNHVWDKDKYKNFMGRITQDIGDFLSIGGFGYIGKEKLDNALNNEITNEVVIMGPDLTLSYSDKLELNYQYTYRKDSEVFPGYQSYRPGIEDIETQGMLAELIYSPKGNNSDWYLMGLYNRVDSDFDPADYQSITFHAGYLVRRNIRFAAEYSFIGTNGRVDEDNYGKFSVGFVSAF